MSGSLDDLFASTQPGSPRQQSAGRPSSQDGGSNGRRLSTGVASTVKGSPHCMSLLFRASLQTSHSRPCSAGYMQHTRPEPGSGQALTSTAVPDKYVPPPRPANEAQRQATVDALGLSDSPTLPTLNSLSQLVRLLGADCCLLCSHMAVRLAARCASLRIQS